MDQTLNFYQLLKVDLFSKENNYKNIKDTTLSLLKIFEDKTITCEFSEKKIVSNDLFAFALTEFSNLLKRENESNNFMFNTQQRQIKEFETFLFNLKSLSKLIEDLDQQYSKCLQMNELCKNTFNEIIQIKKNLNSDELNEFEIRKTSHSNPQFRLFNKNFSMKAIPITDVDKLISLYEILSVYLDHYELEIHDFNSMSDKVAEDYERLREEQKIFKQSFDLNFREIFNLKKENYKQKIKESKELETKLNNFH